MSSYAKGAPVLLILAGAVSLGGCATKSYVREQIAPVSQRVDTLEARLQETDGTAKAALAQSQANGQRLDQIGGRVDSAEQRITTLESRPAKRARH